MMSAQLVREMRRRAGLTQAELARRLGTSQSAVARWEGGRSAPSFETLREVARACDLDLQPRIIDRDDHDLSLALPNLRLTTRRRLERYEDALDQFDALRRARPARA